MYITPVVPASGNIALSSELLGKAERLIASSAKLTGGHNAYFMGAVRDLLRITNSYYSNLIESEGTHPIDIERAMQKDFFQDDKKKNLQLLSLAHIDVQRYIEKSLGSQESLYSAHTLLEIHKRFYSKKEMQFALHIEHGNQMATIVPGKIRDGEVKVGAHIAPKAKELPAYLNEFETLYNQSHAQTKTIRLIYALCSHHRLVYIHPFFDGNGRISRLYLDHLLFGIGLEGYGLWNISRGLAREQEKYRAHLARADEPFLGEYNNGRGALSLKGLRAFANFMLDTALDQVEYMTELLKIDNIASRINSYVHFSRQNMYLDIDPLPKHAEVIFQALLLHGQIPRNSIKDIIRTSKPTAIKVVRELERREYLTSEEPKSPIRIKLNAHFASEIIPKLIGK